MWMAYMLQSNVASAQSCFSLDFSNDVWNTTDRYYTQGLRLSYINPVLVKPVEHLFPKLTSNMVNKLAAVDLFQDMYTPSKSNTNVYDPNDRPYAAVLAITYRYMQQSVGYKSSVQFNALAGVIGKEALGKEIQNGIHGIIDNLDAMGWSYQLKTGVLLNGGLSYEYNLLDQSAVRVSALTGVELGTYKTNAQLGATIYIGKRSETYSLPLQPIKEKWLGQQLVLQSIATVVGHDATLQGAWFQNYTYGIPSDQINRLTLRSKLEYRVLLGHFQLGVAEYIQSPEFNKALWHKWLTINLAYWF
jgi:hypothetical protein